MTAPEGLKQFIVQVTQYLGIPCEVSYEQDADTIHIAISAPESGSVLIGRGGQNLYALEQVSRAVLARLGMVGQRVMVDVNEYRRTKTRAIVDEVRRIAERVRMTRQSETLDPMTSSERRVVHTELASYHDLATESVGQDPERRVVIRPL